MSKKKLKKRNILSRFAEFSSAEKSIISRFLSTNSISDSDLHDLAAKYGPEKLARLLNQVMEKTEKAQQEIEETEKTL